MLKKEEARRRGILCLFNPLYNPSYRLSLEETLQYENRDGDGLLAKMWLSLSLFLSHSQCKRKRRKYGSKTRAIWLARTCAWLKTRNPARCVCRTLQRGAVLLFHVCQALAFSPYRHLLHISRIGGQTTSKTLSRHGGVANGRAAAYGRQRGGHQRRLAYQATAWDAGRRSRTRAACDRHRGAGGSVKGHIARTHNKRCGGTGVDVTRRVAEDTIW